MLILVLELFLHLLVPLFLRRAEGSDDGVDALSQAAQRVILVKDGEVLPESQTLRVGPEEADEH